MINDLHPDGLEEDFEIPTPNVRANVLCKVLEWCEHHKTLYSKMMKMKMLRNLCLLKNGTEIS